MKTTMRYAIAAVLALVAAASVRAQSDPKATIAAIDTVVREYSNYKDVLDPFVEEVYRKFRKNPEVITGIAKAYYTFSKPHGQPYYTFVTRDSANAYKYIELAIENDPTYVPAYILGGDIQVTMDNREGALSWYRRAIAADKANPEGYLAYAALAMDTDSADAVRTLMGVRDYVPDYPVELALARMYETRLDVAASLGYFDKADRDSMAEEDLVHYAMNHYVMGNYRQSLDVASYGHGRYPRNPVFNRLVFWNNTVLKNYDEALAYADQLFNQSDNPEIVVEDYVSYGRAYMGKKQYANAVKMFEKVYTFGKATDKDKDGAFQSIVTAYREMGDYDRAISMYKDYMARLDKEGKLDATEYNQLGMMYNELAEISNGEDKMRAYTQADSVYALMGERFPANAAVALYYRLAFSYSLDPGAKNGLGIPHATGLIAMLEAKPDRSKGEDSFIVLAYDYLSYYYATVKVRLPLAREYCQKALAINPDDAQANQLWKALGGS